MWFSGNTFNSPILSPHPACRLSPKAWLCLGCQRERDVGGCLPLASRLVEELGPCVSDILAIGQTAGKPATCEAPFPSEVSFLLLLGAGTLYTQCGLN